MARLKIPRSAENCGPYHCLGNLSSALGIGCVVVSSVTASVSVSVCFYELVVFMTCVNIVNKRTNS